MCLFENGIEKATVRECIERTKISCAISRCTYARTSALLKEYRSYDYPLFCYSIYRTRLMCLYARACAYAYYILIIKYKKCFYII